MPPLGSVFTVLAFGHLIIAGPVQAGRITGKLYSLPSIDPAENKKQLVGVPVRIRLTDTQTGVIQFRNSLGESVIDLEAKSGAYDIQVPANLEGPGGRRVIDIEFFREGLPTERLERVVVENDTGRVLTTDVVVPRPEITTPCYYYYYPPQPRYRPCGRFGHNRFR